jgi:lipopolysaccharide heptosyltransferase I
MVDCVRSLEEDDHVLLIRLGAVGDVLRTLPALHFLRSTFPSIHISWLVEDLSREVLLEHPEIDQVLLFPRRELREAATRPRLLFPLLAGLRRRLLDGRFTVALDFQGSFKSGLLALLSGAPRRVGFGPGHSRELSFLFTNEWVRPRADRLNRVERNLLLAEAVGARGDTVEAILPERPEDGRAVAEMLRTLNPHGLPLVVLSPGTSRRQRYKRWPADSFSRLATRLAASIRVLTLIVWGPGEEDLARSIAAGSQGCAVPAPPTTLRMLAAILRRASLFVGGDTGPMHLAWEVGCPVLALFGPTDPRLNAPLGSTHAILQAGPSTSDIDPEEALAVALRILGSTRGAGTVPRLERSTVFQGAAGGRP